MTIATPTLYRYRCVYRRDVSGRRHYMTVTARSADEARAKARIRDPQYLASIQVKNVGEVRELILEKHVPRSLACYICQKAISDDLWTNVNFGKTLGLQVVCDLCWERSE